MGMEGVKKNDRVMNNENGNSKFCEVECVCIVYSIFIS